VADCEKKLKMKGLDTRNPSRSQWLCIHANFV